MTARILPTTIETAPEPSKATLGHLQHTFGKIPELFATIAHSPTSLDSLLAWDHAITHSSLSRREIELLNLHVSELNGCGYCVSAHEAFAKHGGLSLPEIERARLGQGANPREDALLALARRVVRAGGARTGAEVAQCREAQVPDASIIDVLAVVALKTFTNAVALVAQTPIDFPKAPRLPQD
jgi:uncharacterized peroxidase-related enzyme